MVALEAWALGTPGARQRQVRRAEGTVPAQQRRPVLRNARRVHRHARGDRTESLAGRIARPQRPPVLPRPLRLAGDRAEVPRDVRAAEEGRGRARRRSAARLVRSPPPGSAGRRRRSSRSCRMDRPGGAGDPDPPGARHARLRRRDRPRSARHSARAARAPATSRRSSSRPPITGSSRRRATTASWSTSATATTCCFTTSRSARRRRARRTRCRIGWRSSTTTSRRRSTSSACTARWRGRRFAAGASCRPTPIAAIWRWATPSSTARISKRSGFPRTAVLPVVPDFSHLDRAAELAGGARLRRRVDQHRVRRPGDRQQEDRGSDRAGSTPTTRSSTRDRGCCWSARRADSSATSRRCTSWSAGSAPRTCTSSATCRTRSWSPSTRSPICFSAPASTKASACRSSRRSTSRCRCWPTPRPRCRRPWTAPACCSTNRDPLHVAALMDEIVSNASLQDQIVDGQLAAVDRLRSKDFAGTLLGFVDRILAAPARAGAARRVRFLGTVRRRPGARGAPDVSPGDLSGAAAAPSLKSEVQKSEGER